MLAVSYFEIVPNSRVEKTAYCLQWNATQTWKSLPVAMHSIDVIVRNEGANRKGESNAGVTHSQF